MTKALRRIRIGVVLVLCLSWLLIASWIVSGTWAGGYASVRSGNYWPLGVLLVLILLVGLHINFQYIARHFEYVSFLTNIVLFVSASTTLTSLSIALATGREFEAWVLPIHFLAVLTLLVILLGQASALRVYKERINRNLERLIWSCAEPSVADAQKRALVSIAKHIMPIDLGKVAF